MGRKGGAAGSFVQCCGGGEGGRHSGGEEGGRRSGEGDRGRVARRAEIEGERDASGGVDLRGEGGV